MKKTILTIALCIISLSFLSAQSFPEGFNYQAVARDANGNAKANTTIGTRYTLRSGSLSGTVVWQETQNIITNAMGQFNHTVGMGTRVGGTALNFSNIVWASAKYYLEVEIQIGASPYASIGNQQLMAVPFAFHSATSDTASYSKFTEWSNYAIYEERYATSLEYASTSGWNIRNLNSTQASAGSSISRSGNTVILNPGTYYIKANAVTGKGARHKVCLKTIAGSVILSGTSANANSSYGGDTESLIDGVVTVTTQTTYRLEHYISSANSSEGLGYASSITGVDEIYARIVIQKIK